MAYGTLRETFRFAWRNIPSFSWLFSLLEARNETVQSPSLAAQDRRVKQPEAAGNDDAYQESVAQPGMHQRKEKPRVGIHQLIDGVRDEARHIDGLTVDRNHALELRGGRDRKQNGKEQESFQGGYQFMMVCAELPHATGCATTV